MKSCRSRQTEPRGRARTAQVDATRARPLPFGKRCLTSTFGQGLASGLLVWAALPPLGLWPLAWVAPWFWLRLIRRPTLAGSRPYAALYLAGFVHWLIMVQWIRLPHWSAYFGWLALAFYLAFYVPLFIGLSRIAVHRLGVSVVLAAPIVWTGLELLRGHMLTGFSLGLLGHTQVAWIELIQIADLVGAYGVSFVIVLVAASVARALPNDHQPRSAWPIAVIPTTMAAVLTYGHWRVNGTLPASDRPPIRVALIQGSWDTQFSSNPAEVDRESQQSFLEYCQLSRQAVSGVEAVDLIVWPESMFTFQRPLVTYDADLAPDPDWDIRPETFRERVQSMREECEQKMVWVARELDTPLLVGTEARHYGDRSMQVYNSAILIDRTGRLRARYDKMHPVMFGEYVPLGTWLPWLYRLTPMHGGLTPGRGPIRIPIRDLQLSPTICFENTVPHLIRRQVRELHAEGRPPDVLVTLTNDGWFWGSCLLDLHLVCGIFRAVEMRLPVLIAANTGFSASIDGTGHVREKGPRRATAVVTSAVHPDGRWSLYLWWGDVFAGGCLVFCLLAAGVGMWPAMQNRATGTSPAGTT